MTIKPYQAFILLLLIVAIPLFAHLDSSPLAEWDESRVANNSLEMTYNHNWIVTSYNDQPDMWCTKPPFLVWMQVISMKIFGVNELGFRLPSAIAALGTCFLLFFFFMKKYKNPWLGLISVAILVTTDGYIHAHTARTGDYDSLLTMFMTGYVLFYFLYLEEGKRKYIYATFIFLTLAGLTKGIQALLFLPALLIYTVYKNKTIATLKSKELYIGIAGFIFFVIGYYLLREHYNPGYIAAVMKNELGGRYNTVLENHSADGFFYYDQIIYYQFSYWYLFIVPGIVLGLCSNQKWLRDFTVYALLLVLFYFFVVSNGQTKIYWYIMELYPFLSALVAIFIYSIFKALSEMDVLKQIVKYNCFPFVFVFFIFIAPYTTAVNLVLSHAEGSGDTNEMKNMQLFLQDVFHKRINMDGYTIVNLGTQQQLLWYYKAYTHLYRPMRLIGEKDVVPNSAVLAYDPATKKFIEDHFNTQIMHTYYSDVTEYKINDRK